MKTAVKPRRKSEAEILDQATNQLLRAIKEKAAKSGKPLDLDKLRRDGYSERFLARLEEA
ncbi:MAG: hypothetical protein HY300_17850 [Verrucomicrobia bacterium]|nr:hypothetical protein [Verrucomicrobiota bacterium]